jgi:hypothetical protein
MRTALAIAVADWWERDMAPCHALSETGRWLIVALLMQLQSPRKGVLGTVQHIRGISYVARADMTCAVSCCVVL